MSEGRRLREKAVDFAQENRPAQGDEDRLDQTRSELERLDRQLEQLQRDLLRRESLNIGGTIVREARSLTTVPADMINHQLVVFHPRSSSIEVSFPLW